jgi:putative addiction module component (TIGR02574 family)
MPLTLTPADLEKLSIEERLKLMEMLWASLGDKRDSMPSPDWHEPVVEKRMQRMREQPSPGTPAEDALNGLGKPGK